MNSGVGRGLTVAVVDMDETTVVMVRMETECVLR